MGIFGKKKDRTVDLTERYRKQQERMSNLRESMNNQNLNTNPPSQENAGGLSFLGGLANAGAQNRAQTDHQTYGNQDPYSGNYGDSDEKKRKLAKRLMDITDKLEDISNQLYHLQQRVEVLEKKANPQGLGF